MAGALELGDVEDSPAFADDVAAPGESSELGEMPLPLPDPTPLASLPSAPPSSPPFSFWSLSCCSRPSTRFNNASRMSVFGPRFLGTASRGGPG